MLLLGGFRTPGHGATVMTDVATSELPLAVLA